MNAKGRRSRFEGFGGSEALPTGAECRGHSSALALDRGCAIFIGTDINSDIERAASEGGNPDVRRDGENRSGGTLQTNKDS
jgi:hypothetical protein